MSEFDAIIEIAPEARVNNEDMGSKPKFWFRHEDDLWLYKQARKNTGEHWAEKVASEIAELIGLPTHEVRLANYEEQVGCAVKNFLKEGETLIHGNELLFGAIEGYDKDKEQGQSDHHFDNIIQALEKTFPEPGVRQSLSLRFVGYLVLDALVGNTDRHHENWGMIQKLMVHVDEENLELTAEFKLQLAPTFDHGSSLGRELLQERAERLLKEDANVIRYIKKAKGGIFRDSTAKKGMAPIALVELIAAEYPDLFQPWKEKIQELPDDFAQPLLDKIPDSYMPPVSKQFALAFLAQSRKLITSIP